MPTPGPAAFPDVTPVSVTSWYYVHHLRIYFLTYQELHLYL